MANLKLASAFLFCFLSLSYALTSSDIPDATDVAFRDIQYDDIIVLPSSDSQQTVLPKSESESSSVPIDENLIPVDLTEVKEDRDDLPNSSPLEVVSFHHINRHHRPRRAGRKEISYGNDMIMSSHENFENLGFEEDQGFGEDGGLRRFHHHHHHHHHDFDGEVEGMKKEGDEHPHGHHHHHHFDREVEGMEKEGDEHPHGHHHHFDGEVEGMEKEGDEHPHGHHHHHFDGEVEAMEKEGDEHPHGHWFHQRKFGGEEEHPFHHRFHHHHHHHHHEEEEHEEAGLLFKLKQYFNGF